MKIIHTGDIHLDSSFTSQNVLEAQKRRTALRSAFSSLMLYARTEKVDLFLICGDLFDDESVTKDTLTSICSQMADLKECTFIITPGNHDPYKDGSPYKLIEFPENVFIFTSPSLSYIDIAGTNVRVYGSAYLSDTKEEFTSENIPILDKQKINILMHHGDIGVKGSPYSSISTSVIEKCGFDYVALGHVHKGSEISSLGSTCYAYCGCLEGRDFGECGYKGAIVGEIEKGKAELRHVRFSSKRYETVKIDVTGNEAFADCISTVTEKCVSYGDDTLLRIEFSGVVSEGFIIDENLLRLSLPNPSYLEIKDKTLPLLNMKSLKEDKTLAGEFYRALEEKLFSDNDQEKETASMALKYGLRAIYGMELKG